MPPFGFRVRALVLRDRLPATDVGGSIEMRFGDRRMSLAIEKGTSRRPDHLVLKESGFVSEEAARSAGQKAKSALRATGVATDVSMDLGLDLASTGIGQIVKDMARDNMGVDLRGDVHGIDVFDEAGPEVQYLRMEGEGSVTANLSEFVETLSRFLESTSGAGEDERVKLASEIYMAGAFESTDRARFVTYITVLEILANRECRLQPALDVISAALRELEQRVDLDPDSEQSLRSGLLDLRTESISAGIRSLIESVDTSKLDLGGRSSRQFINECYGARSKLVHDGQHPAGFDIRADTPRLARVAREVLLSRLAVE